MSTPLVRMRLVRLAFTGPERDPVTVPYGPGLTIVWGASNHGKSFTAQAIDFVLGRKDPLVIPNEGRGLDRCTLWLDFTDGTAFTLQRAVAGGAVEMADGHHGLVGPSSKGYRNLSAQHAEQRTTLSSVLLDRLGFRRAQLLKNERAEKSAFTFRTLMRYLFVDEGRIIHKNSVIMREGNGPTAEDKSLLKFLVTGIDGSAVATVPTRGEQTAVRGAKIDVLKDLLAETVAQIDASRTDEALENAIETVQEARDGADMLVRRRQEALDAARETVSASRSKLREVEAASADLRAMVLRFQELQRTLVSDVARLGGLEEGGFLLRTFTAMACPLCGADPKHQRHDHGMDHVEDQRQAAEAEMTKIRGELRELDATLDQAAVDIADREREAAGLRERIEVERGILIGFQGDDRGVRARFVEAVETLRMLQAEKDRRLEGSRLETRIAALEGQTIPGRPRAEDFDPSLSTSEAHDVAQVVKRVLAAWDYPGAETVTFDLGGQDLIVDGKERRQNGKGVRAILH